MFRNLNLSSLLKFYIQNKEIAIKYSLFSNCYEPFQGISPRKMSSFKCNSPEFHSLFTPELQRLLTIFQSSGHEIRIAGGAVRDLLIGKIPHDVDFATTATPQEMIAIFETENIRMINNKGECHGTITCRINDKENFEITTLRIDKETDGRHAKVEFTKDWILDALRRDLTINSMFLGLDGTLYDYFDGYNDLLDQKVRFVGNASERIQEDYLRILRYFRFYGKIAKSSNEHQDITLKSIRDNATGLIGISGERVWVEVKKILQGRFVCDLFELMNELSVLKYLGFTEPLNFKEFRRVVQNTVDLKALPITLLTALFYQQTQLDTLHARVKMSKDELQTATLILNYREDVEFVLESKDLHPFPKDCPAEDSDTKLPIEMNITPDNEDINKLNNFERLNRRRRTNEFIKSNNNNFNEEPPPSEVKIKKMADDYTNDDNDDDNITNKNILKESSSASSSSLEEKVDFSEGTTAVMNNMIIEDIKNKSHQQKKNKFHQQQKFSNKTSIDPEISNQFTNQFTGSLFINGEDDERMRNDERFRNDNVVFQTKVNNHLLSSVSDTSQRRELLTKSHALTSTMSHDSTTKIVMMKNAIIKEKVTNDNNRLLLLSKSESIEDEERNELIISVTSDIPKNQRTLYTEEVALLNNNPFIAPPELSDNYSLPLNRAQDLICDLPGHVQKTKERVSELLKYLNLRRTLMDFESWTLPKFPVSGMKLAEMGVKKGPVFAKTLDSLKNIWKMSRFAMNEEDLLKCLDSNGKLKKNINVDVCKTHFQEEGVASKL